MRDLSPPVGGFLHRWHPLTKLALLIASLVLAYGNLFPVAGASMLSLAVALGLLVLAFADSRHTGIETLRATLLALLPISISLFLIQGFFSPFGEEVIWQIGPLSLKREGLLFAASVASRLTLILVASVLFIRTTDPADLTLALTQIGVPREFAYVILSALQLLPRMRAKAQAITSAQQARGLRTEGNLWVRIRALVPLVGPLITSALNESQERALALEVRAFRAPGPKTAWRQLTDTPTQRIARWLLVVGALAIVIWLRLLAPRL